MCQSSCYLMNQNWKKRAMMQPVYLDYVCSTDDVTPWCNSPLEEGYLTMLQSAPRVQLFVTKEISSSATTSFMLWWTFSIVMLFLLESLYLLNTSAVVRIIPGQMILISPRNHFLAAVLQNAMIVFKKNIYVISWNVSNLSEQKMLKYLETKTL